MKVNLLAYLWKFILNPKKGGTQVDDSNCYKGLYFEVNFIEISAKFKNKN
jgi:hypothetical protein